MSRPDYPRQYTASSERTATSTRNHESGRQTTTETHPAPPPSFNAAPPLGNDKSVDKEKGLTNDGVYVGAPAGAPLKHTVSVVSHGGKSEKTVDAVWGEISDDGPNYRNVSWKKACVLLVKVMIGIGVLGLPNVFNIVGWVPGVLLILAASIITTWSAYVVGQFKLHHPQIYSQSDVGQLMGGAFGRELLGIFYWLHITAVGGAGLLSFSVCLNAVTVHGACTVAFVIVGLVIGFLLASIQTLDKIAWIGWVGLVSIIASIIALCISVGVQDRPADAPQTGEWNTGTEVFKHPNFVEGMNAVNIVVFAFAGTPYMFNVIGEMRDQSEFTKSVCISQGFVTAVYMIVACIVYRFCGQYVASPALGSAGVLMKRVCYGLAMPALIATIVLSTHIPAKYVLVRILGGSKHLANNTKTHYAAWFGVVLFNITISFLIAMAIPFFNDLVSLLGAFLGTFICIQTETYMWLWDNIRPKRRDVKWGLLVAMNITFHLLGWFVMVAGTYAAVVAINDSLMKGSTSSPFSCADNSNSHAV